MTLSLEGINTSEMGLGDMMDMFKGLLQAWGYAIDSGDALMLASWDQEGGETTTRGGGIGVIGSRK